MKTLVDTSVWSLSLRRRPSAPLQIEEQRLVALLLDAISEGRVAMIGPIRQELLSGIKERPRYAKLRRHLRAFLDEPLETADYEEAARLFNLRRSRGIQSGPIDILICAVALRRGWEVLSCDAGLDRCLKVLAAPSTPAP